ncbi:unnamed protein product [Albugo candida]|uniref:Uncharacterized protein n=1 Tax=Albugo candida TaxID=65357 RepID=A0A024G4K4_9STRA|nr:unnamed protein product [Albugo candida]|eukprot:CCI41784.1 unnamed protein product [Albugo candida]
MHLQYQQSVYQIDTYHNNIDTPVQTPKTSPRDRVVAILVLNQASVRHRVQRLQNQLENMKPLPSTEYLASGYPYAHISVHANQQEHARYKSAQQSAPNHCLVPL